MVASILMITNNIITKTLIQYFIHVFYLAISLQMESDVKF
jgi:hypothetical protein